MKKIVQISLIMIFCTQYLESAKITIMNLMSNQATVSIDTQQKSYSVQVNPNENAYIKTNLDNASNQYDNSLTSISFDQSPIKKITIKRMQSDIQQIIYYNGEFTSDKNNKPSGIYDISLSGTGLMKIVQNSVTINNQTYNINDVNSFKLKCKKLSHMLSEKKDLSYIQQETNDLAQSLRLFESSDLALSLSLKITVIRSELDNVVNKLQIIGQLKEYNNSLVAITKTLTDENIDSVENQLASMIAGLQSLDDSEILAMINIEKINKDIAELQSKILVIRNKLSAMNHATLVD